MYTNKITFVIVVLFTYTFFYGCSGGTTPVTTDYSVEPIGTELNDPRDMSSGLGLLGSYKLIINSQNKSAELVPDRNSAIGEDFIVSGINYFIDNPCTQCLTIQSFSPTQKGNLEVLFSIEHPFAPGNPAEPPSAKNRLDLDLFDLAMVAYPLSGASANYPLTQENVYTDLFGNSDGYTTELTGLVSDPAALPYFLVIDDSDSGLNTWNKFGMGDNADFSVEFILSGDDPSFNLYLTMGYGASATFETRFEPKYYNPEFNRKAAWKVEVAPAGHWIESINPMPVDVIIKVYDWQLGATVYTDPPNFADAPIDNIFAASAVATVTAEIPGMNPTLPSVSSPDSGTGTPDDPLIYKISIMNQNNLAAGDYTGLVKVTDERRSLEIIAGRDFLVDKPIGEAIVYHTMPEYATYQTFPATVVSDCSGYCWTKTWGGTESDDCQSVVIDQWGNIYTMGNFHGTVDFDPGINVDEHTSTDMRDCYLSKFTPNGDWQWTKTWGGDDDEWVNVSTIDNSDNIYVAGYFYQTADFNPAGGGTKTAKGEYDAYLSKFDTNGNWQGTVTWGGVGEDEPYSITHDNSGNIYVASYFDETVDFNPEGGELRTPEGISDAYVSKFDSNGIWQWTRTWGSLERTSAGGVATDSIGNVYVAGFFQGTCEFNPAGGSPMSSNGGSDSYLNKLDTHGNWQMAKTWGGLGLVTCSIVTIDDFGNLYVGGSYHGIAGFNPEGGVVFTSNGQSDPYITAFDLDGTWRFTSTWGGQQTERITAIAVDPVGHIFVGGAYNGTAAFNPAGGAIETSNGEFDAYLNKFDIDGNWISVKSWGGPGYDLCDSISSDYEGNIYIGSNFEIATDFNPEGGNFHVSNGYYDAYLSKMRY